MGANMLLHTDSYEFTMLTSAVAAGIVDQACSFEMFTRRIPAGRKFGVFAGIDRFLAALEDFKFSTSEVNWLEDAGFVDEATAGWLKNFRFSGDIRAYKEGSLFNAGSPLVNVSGGFGECVLLETLLLSMCNHDSAVASAAAHMVDVAAGKTLIDMGSRRAHEQAAVSAARAAIVAGFNYTSNVAAGIEFGLPVRGTAAHAWTLVNASEDDAFKNQAATQGLGTTFLVDTFDITAAVDGLLARFGPNFGAVRIDSGDLAANAAAVRQQLDDAGSFNTKIIVSGDLDAERISELATAPIDGFGVGTKLVAGDGHPSAGFVYKLVATSFDGVMTPVVKASANKVNVAGAKQAFMVDGVERVLQLTEPVPVADRVQRLDVPVVVNGKVINPVSKEEAVVVAKANCELSVQKHATTVLSANEVKGLV